MTVENEQFWQLLKPIYQQTLMFCRKLMNDKDKGDDLFQESLLTGIRKFSQLRNVGSFKPWIYKIIMTTFKATIRKNRFKKYISLNDEITETMITDDPTNSQLARIQLEKLFRSLTPDNRSLIVLYELEGWSIIELSRLFGKSEGAIKLKLFRARNKLKKEMSRLDQQSLFSIKNIFKDVAEKYAL